MLALAPGGHGSVGPRRAACGNPGAAPGTATAPGLCCRQVPCAPGRRSNPVPGGPGHPDGHAERMMRAPGRLAGRTMLAQVRY